MKRTLAHFAAVCGGRLAGADANFGEAVIDSRSVARGDLFLALPGARTDGHQYVAAAAAAGAAGAVVNRELDAPLPQIVVDDVERALGKAGAAWRAAYAGTVLGVAGSNGKTTTKEMLGSILAQAGPCLMTRGNLNNQLGVPLTLLRLRGAERCAVIEIGANRAGEVAALAALARPHIGLVTNAGAEHLEGFGSLEGAARAEGELLAALGADDVAIVNHDDPFAEMWRGMTRARVVGFGLNAGAEVGARALELEVGPHGFHTRFILHAAAGEVAVALALAGRHNVLNALGAAAAALAAGATLAQVAVGLAAIRPVAGRLQFRHLPGGAWLIDDSYNANPSSARAALEVLAELPGRRWFVLGDMAELGDHASASHREIGTLARTLGVERLCSFGPLAALAAESFGSGAERYADMDALARALGGSLPGGVLPGDVRLLVKGSRLNRLERLVASLTGAGAAQQVQGPAHT